MTVVISDTSPIRALAHLRLIHLLKQLYGPVLIPPSVEAELTAVGVQLPGDGTFSVKEPNNLKLVARLNSRLDPGESEAIALAVEYDATLLLIDEAKGRAMATSLGLACKGVLGILLDAKAASLITAVGPLARRLVDELKFFVSPVLMARLLSLAGESDDSSSAPL